MKEQFEKGMTFQEFLQVADESQHPWREYYQRARIPGDILTQARNLPGHWYLLALSEAWCGDGANTIPYVARLAEETPQLDLRILPRDEHPHLMDAHLTQGARAIPVVLILDEEYREVAWWGPRPKPLQDIFLREIKRLPEPQRYPLLRAWYARDRGRTVLEEIFHRLPVTV